MRVERILGLPAFVVVIADVRFVMVAHEYKSLLNANGVGAAMRELGKVQSALSEYAAHHLA